MSQSRLMASSSTGHLRSPKPPTRTLSIIPLLDFPAVLEKGRIFEYGTLEFLRVLLEPKDASLLRQQDLESIVALSITHYRTKTGSLHEVVEFQIILGREQRWIEIDRSEDDNFLKGNKTSTFWKAFVNLFGLNCGALDSVRIATVQPKSKGDRYRIIRSVIFEHPLNLIQLATLAAALSLSSPNYSHLKYNCLWWATSLFDIALEASRTDPSNVVPGDGYHQLSTIYKLTLMKKDYKFRFFSNNRNFQSIYDAFQFGMRRERLPTDVVEEICSDLERAWTDLSLYEQRKMEKEPRRRIWLLQRLLERWMLKELKSQRERVEEMEIKALRVKRRSSANF